ncbi:type II toxin-antitoxin system RelE/ParE family toxin [Methylopila sp. M107]|uniref:type II toxin-antitoxin system RelE/ParE family toxin n=1 Tax=Methylopila sp. M107 TaxID=1101190 RepID=UPI001FD910BD|nr:type II toxin-antitoxin system RelE/ParE family toxin [Methylopila sp. M107]
MFGARQAERYAAELRAAFELIASQPRMCRERSEFRPPLRIHVHAAHALLYLIDGPDAVVVRILHRSRDLRRHV